MFHRASVAFQLARPNEALTIYKESSQLYAKSARLREFAVVEEIKNLQGVYSELWKNKKIAVIQGAAHTQTYHEYKKRNPRVQTERKMPPIFVYPLTVRTLRKLSMLPGKKISEDEYKKCMLADFLFPIFLDKPKISREEKDNVSSRLFSQMSYQDAQILWNKIIMASLEHGENPNAKAQNEKDTQETYTILLKQISDRLYEIFLHSNSQYNHN